VSIIDDDADPRRETIDRPWWFAPALAAVALGGVVGVALLPTEGGPSTTPPPSERQLLAVVTPPATPTPRTSPPLCPSFAPPTRPARVFVFDPAASPTACSRYVLYDDGSVAGQWRDVQSGEVRGTYTEANGALSFDWGNPISGYRQAILHDDSLIIVDSDVPLRYIRDGPPAWSFPPLAGPARVFAFDHLLQTTWGLDQVAARSRVVLYDDGRVELQYLGAPPFAYGGKYVEEAGVVRMTFDSWGGGGAYGATGSLRNGSLAIEFSESMHWNDFTDAGYAQTTPP
jgi:hypothetical protein